MSGGKAPSGSIGISFGSHRTVIAAIANISRTACANDHHEAVGVDVDDPHAAGTLRERDASEDPPRTRKSPMNSKSP
jgi:hypothetical protein